MNIKTCSFFGHRKIEITEELKQKVKEVIEDFSMTKEWTGFNIHNNS